MCRTPNSELRTISVKHSEDQTPDSGLIPTVSLEEALLQAEFSSSRKVLFSGEGVAAISSYVAGWMASRGLEVIVLDGANRFDPYAVSSLARRVLIPPEELLRSIRIARAFTCYQMAALMGEKLPSLLNGGGGTIRKPLVILLGPVTAFLDEDVPEGEADPLLERSLKRMDALAAGGVSSLVFQSLVPSHSRRAYLMKKLFDFSNVAWRISVDDEGPQAMLEKGPNETCNFEKGPTSLSLRR